MTHIVTPRPELFPPMPTDETQLAVEAATNEVLPVVRAAAAAAGFPDALWSRRAELVLCREALRTGILMPMLPLPEFAVNMTPLTPAQKRALPERAVREAYHMLQFSKIQWFCFTQGEDWWAGPRSFIADTVESYARMHWYALACRKEPELREFAPPAGPGRPRKDPSEKAAKTTPYGDLWPQWLTYCATRKSELAELEQRYRDAAIAADNAKRVWKQHESATALTWEHYKAQYGA